MGIAELGMVIMDFLPDYMVLSLLLVCKHSRQITTKLAERKVALCKSFARSIFDPLQMFGSIIIDENFKFISWLISYYNIKKTLTVNSYMENQTIVQFIESQRIWDINGNQITEGTGRKTENKCAEIHRYFSTIDLPIIFLMYGSSKALDWYNSITWMVPVLHSYKSCIIAIHFGNIEALNWLKKNQIKMGQHLDYKHKILAEAAASGHIHSLDWCISEYGELEFDCTLLSTALKHGQYQMCDYILAIFKNVGYAITVANCEELCIVCLKASESYPGIEWILKSFDNYRAMILYQCHNLITSSSNDTFLEWCLEKGIFGKNDNEFKTGAYMLNENLLLVLTKYGVPLPPDFHLTAVRFGNKTFIRTVFGIHPLIKFDINFQKRMGVKIWKIVLQKTMTKFRSVTEDYPSDRIRTKFILILIDFDVYKDERVLAKAATHGCLNLVKYLRTGLKLPWDESTIISAMDSGYQDIAIWAIRSGCPLTLELMAMAYSLHDEVLCNALMDAGCPWNPKLLEFLQIMDIFWKQEEEYEAMKEKEDSDEKSNDEIDTNQIVCHRSNNDHESRRPLEKNRNILLNGLNNAGRLLITEYPYGRIDVHQSIIENKIDVHQSIIQKIYTGKSTLFKGFRRMKARELEKVLNFLYD
jgi:hypothetical protein